MMGRVAALLGLMLAVTAAVWAGTAAQFPCAPTLASLGECSRFIQGDSKDPSPACCTALGSVIKSQLDCLCQLLEINTPPELVKRAFSLPPLCNLPALPTDPCNGTAPAPPSVGKTPTTPPSAGGSPISMTLGVFFCSIFFAVASSVFVL